MVRIIEHLPIAELERRYRAAEDATEARHIQAIWLLAQGRTVLDVAGVLAFVPRSAQAGLCLGWRNWRHATTRMAPRPWATSGGATGVPPAC